MAHLNLFDTDFRIEAISKRQEKGKKKLALCFFIIGPGTLFIQFHPPEKKISA